MKKLFALLLAAVLLLSAGCTVIVPAAPAATTPAASTEAAPTTAAPAAPESTAAPILPTEAPASTAAPTEPVSTAPVTTEPVSTAAPSTTAAPVPTTTEPEPPVSQDPWGYLCGTWCEAGTYTDQYDNEYDYSYDVPGIDDDRAGAQEINQDIDRTVMEHIREAHRDMDNKDPIGIPDIGFHAEVWADVLSLIVVEHFYIDGHEDYHVYLYETTTGLRLSTEMLLEKMGISETDFLDAAEAQMRQFFLDSNSSIPADKWEEYGLNEALARLPYYVNLEDILAYPVEDDLVIIAPIPSAAGPLYFYETIYLGLGGQG